MRNRGWPRRRRHLFPGRRRSPRRPPRRSARSADRQPQHPRPAGAGAGAFSTSVGATLKPPVMMSSFDAVDDAHETGVVDRHDVARAVPPVDEDGLGLLGLAVVARETPADRARRVLRPCRAGTSSLGFSGSTTRHSVPGRGSPTVPGTRLSATGLAMRTGEHSLSPYPRRDSRGWPPRTERPTRAAGPWHPRWPPRCRRVTRPRPSRRRGGDPRWAARAAGMSPGAS